MASTDPNHMAGRPIALELLIAAMGAVNYLLIAVDKA
jgi:hypothetical protein